MIIHASLKFVIELILYMWITSIFSLHILSFHSYFDW